jgi:transposase-like protein
VTPPTVIGVDKNPSYPPAFTELQQESQLPAFSKLRQVRYLNNRLEGDHRFTKRRIRYKQWFQTFRSAAKTIAGYETMHSLRKGQIRHVPKKNVLLQKRFIEKLFSIAA